MRTPSMSLPEVEAALGQRGHLPFSSSHRGNLRKWLTTQGFPSLFVIGLSIKEMTAAYNDVSGKAIADIKRKLESGNELREQEEQEAKANESKIEATTINEIGNIVETHKADSKGKGHKIITALEELFEQTNAGVDEDKVRDIVRHEMAQHVSITRIELKKHDGQLAHIDGHHHPNFPILCKLASTFDGDGYIPGIWLAGEASSGKTHHCGKLAQLLNLPFHFNGAISMPHEMLGFIDGAGIYHRTPFREAYEHGGVYCFDECDRSDPNALLAVNPHLANNIASFPDRQIRRHPNCIIIATANTWGTGPDAKYVGATKLDAAFLSRFPRKLPWNIDLELERKIAGNDSWVARVQQARKNAERHGLKVMIDMRVTLAGAAMLASGLFTEDETAQFTYLANVTPDQRKQLESN